jgi:hypothetical protein
MSPPDFDAVLEAYQRALGEFLKGNPEAVKRRFSHREDGTWRVLHRHADPITTAQPIESVIQQ